jgi:hypothetical protein
MDGIVKIVLALKLKFLLIILSIGTSYFLEHSHKKKVDAVSSIETISPDTSLRGSGHIDIRSLFKVADDNQGSQLKSSDHIHIQPVNYVTNRLFCSQDLEIYIVL